MNRSVYQLAALDFLDHETPLRVASYWAAAVAYHVEATMAEVEVLCTIRREPLPRAVEVAEVVRRYIDDAVRSRRDEFYAMVAGGPNGEPLELPQRLTVFWQEDPGQWIALSELYRPVGFTPGYWEWTDVEHWPLDLEPGEAPLEAAVRLLVEEAGDAPGQLVWHELATGIHTTEWGEVPEQVSRLS